MRPVDVTIAMATRDRSALLGQALASIDRQTLHDHEVFVVDDGSSSEEVAKTRALFDRLDSRFNFLQPLGPGETGSGPSAARNRAISAGSGRYVAFLDDDDVWTFDDHLKVAVDMLDRTNADLYCGDMQGFRGDTLVWDTWFPDRRELLSGERLQVSPSVYRVSRSAFVRAATHRIVHLNTVVIRRSLIERTGGFLLRLRYAEDLEFILRIVDQIDTMLFCEQHVARHRFPSGDSYSLTIALVERHLQTLAAAQHLRVVARSSEVRHAARRLEAWTLRLLSHALRERGRRGTAIGFAIQALVTFPAAGAFRELALALTGSRTEQSQVL
jgi:glycosyltransferase involved in cell wall biosynthesis